MKESNQAFIHSYLSNTQVNLEVVAHTKVSESWKDTNNISPYNRFYFIRQGRGRIEIGGKVYCPVPGQLVLIPAGTVYSYGTEPADTYLKYWCHFTAEIGDVSLFDLLVLPSVIDVRDEAYLEGCFRRLMDLTESGEFTSALRSKAVLLDIICLYIEHTSVDTIRTGGSSMEKINRVLQYIDSHLAESVTVEELAKLVHFHPNYFIRFFKTMLGSPPILYITKRRMEKAKTLLVTTDKSISEIAEEVGLQLHYFSRAFRGHSGFSPTEYRQQRLED
ncbi:AraC family transcriptional regulator [Paenibacillus aurantius]|uniref:AraC family transcriptional regulator n=1 Tax=Paenibacillus aurantius TaxID=2918900 RepID=A0AA96RE15_9BACL|nr:AraC family transcriptional regulator [Paenibacillus aurantius]WNQ10016.1 AraC family transcriptional regulator [Paenibacillus aurantius]